MGHGVVGVFVSHPQQKRAACLKSQQTAGRLRGIMWCFGMRHFATWWVTVVWVGLASVEAYSRASGGKGPVTGGIGSRL